MTFPHVTTPNEVRYGYGLEIRNYSDAKLVKHGGSIKGVSAHMARLKDFTAIVLINLAEVDAEGILLTALTHVAKLPDQDKVITEYKLTSEQIAKYAGTYESDEGQKID